MKEVLREWASHLVHLNAARAFIVACEAEGVEVLPVKGIVTSRMLYQDPVQRRLSDVDVRIRPEDYGRIGVLARRKGWRVLETKRAYRNYVLRLGSDLEVDVDVESYVGPPHVCRLATADMLARATRSELLGFPALVPELHDHAVLLIVNVFKDKLVLANTGAVGDLERLTKHPLFQPSLLVRRLRDAWVATIGFVVADWMVRTAGAEGWSEVRAELEPLASRKLYLRSLEWARTHPFGLAEIFLARIASDSRAERLRALGTMARWRAEVAVGISSKGPPGS